MPTNANTPDQRSDRYARYIQVSPTPATHLSRWVHPNGTTKSHPPPPIVKALTPSQLADTPSSALPHNHAHLGRASLPMRSNRRSMPIACEPRDSQGGPHCHLIGREHGLLEFPLDLGKDIEGAKVCAAEEHGVGLGPVGGDHQITDRFVAHPED